MNHWFNWFSHAMTYGVAMVVLLAVGSFVAHLLPLS
jgi:hypothetical protein